MDTPICDFVQKYVDRGAIRMHMPGHKGRGPVVSASGNNALSGFVSDSGNIGFSGKASLLYEADITEIGDAHYMYELFGDGKGIVARSEMNASALFGCPTYYSTEGSSLCIRAMLYLCTTHKQNRRVLAARNVHQTFLSAAALLDLDVTWLWPSDDSLLSMDLDARTVDESLRAMENKPCCVYLTSPDYLGHILPIREISDVCHAHGVPLVVDNAHGAYLRFLAASQHPCGLGADLCCDSAHKTLPVLTGGAYLHVNPACADSGLSELTPDRIRSAMALFASTSPSWLILQSLDLANAILADESYRTRLADTVRKTAALKKELQQAGYRLFGEEPCKITILTRSRHLSGQNLAGALACSEDCTRVECAKPAKAADGLRPVEVEYADNDVVVLMPSTETTDEEWAMLRQRLREIPEEVCISEETCENEKKRWRLRPTRAMTVREAAMLPYEVVPLEKAQGRIAHMMPCSCPPCVPIVVCGEKIEADEITSLAHFGYSVCKVVVS